MKLIQHRFYSGPNVWYGQSGLLLDCLEDDFSESWASLVPNLRDKALGRLIRLLREIVPVFAESEIACSPETCRDVAALEAYWVLALAEVMSRDFSWQPDLGRVASHQNRNLQLFVPCCDKEVGLAAVGFALSVVRAAPGGRIVDEHAFRVEVSKDYQRARVQARYYGLNQSTLALARCASSRGIPVLRMSVPGQLTQLGHGVHRRDIMETATSFTSSTARFLSKDKLATSTLLARAGLPTPDTHAVKTAEEAMAVAERLGFPLVVKPRMGGKGYGVTVNIRTHDKLREALRLAAQNRQGLIVERHVPGDDHRLLLVDGRLVAAAKRLPAHVTGDGASTIEELVDRVNCDPQRGMPFERLREKIVIDDEALKHLALVGLTPHAIPGPGQVVRLRGTANISRGGMSIDVTDEVHPDNRRIAERAARLIGLDVAGIDFLTADIRRSWREVPSAILEVNSTPGLRPHLGSNLQRDVVSPIIDHLFPAPANGRVPTVGITGSVGKTTTTHMVAAIMAAAGKVVAMTTTQGAWIGNERVRDGDLAGGAVALQLLQDPTVDAAAFELSRGGLLKSGMSLDGVDVGVVLNVYDNHVGIDGVGSREQLAGVKSLVVRHASEWAVLNADDPLCLAMRSVSKAKQLCLVTVQPDNSAVLQHIARGGTAVTLRGEGADASLVLRSGGNIKGQIRLADIPATYGGTFRPTMFNAMFATAAAHGLGLPFECIQRALTQFRSDLMSNPGRMNRIKGLPFNMFLAQSDGPQTLIELARFVNSEFVSRPKSILLTAAGNRPDQFIIDSGRAVGGAFDRYICTDMESNLRGRKPGEVASLLAEGMKQAGVPEAAISVEPSGDAAIALAMADAKEGSLLVAEYYYFKELAAVIKSRWPQAEVGG